MDWNGIHDAVWPGEDDPEAMVASCELCGNRIDIARLDEHLSQEHDIEVELARWPDGGLVVIDESLTPDDFA